MCESSTAQFCTFVVELWVLKREMEEVKKTSVMFAKLSC